MWSSNVAALPLLNKNTLFAFWRKKWGQTTIQSLCELVCRFICNVKVLKKIINKDSKSNKNSHQRIK